MGANLRQAGRILKAKGAVTCLGVEGTGVVPAFVCPGSSPPAPGALYLLLQDFSLQRGISCLTLIFYLFPPLVEHCGAAIVLEEQKAPFTSPRFSQSAFPWAALCWARWVGGAGAACWLTYCRRGGSAGRQAGTDRQGQAVSLPCLQPPAPLGPSVGCGAGEVGWPRALAGDCAAGGREGPSGTGGPLSTTLGITHRLGNRCACQFGCSNHVKSNVYSWGKYNVKKFPKVIVVALGKKKPVKKPLQTLE